MGDQFPDLPLLQQLIGAAKSNGLREVEMAASTWRVRCAFRSTPDGSAPAPVSRQPWWRVAHSPFANQLDLAVLFETGQLHVVRSHSVGYWRPAPTVVVGSLLRAGQVVGHLNIVGVDVAVTTPAAGTVMAVYREPDDPVDYGQLLVAIRCAERRSAPGQAKPVMPDRTSEDPWTTKR